MFHHVTQHNTIIDLPIFALMLFIAIFVIVSIYVWRRGAANPEHQHLANLPLEDDDVLSIPNNENVGGDHGRR